MVVQSQSLFFGHRPLAFSYKVNWLLNLKQTYTCQGVVQI